MKGSTRSCITGVAAALVTGAGFWLIPARYALDGYAILLVLTASIYLGSALSQPDRHTLMREAAAAAAFIVLALVGHWTAPRFLIVGYLAYGLWDALHGMRAIRVPLKAWWPPFCLCYDWVVAVLIYLRWPG